MRDVKVRAIGSQKIVRVTVWAKHEHVPLEKGDFIVAEGAWRSRVYQTREGEKRTSYDLDAATFVRLPGVPKRDVESVASVAAA